MRVTALQLAARFDRKGEALARARELVLEAPTDLVVFPEASITGYVSPAGDFDVSHLAEPIDGPSMCAAADLARAASAFVAVPLIERAEGAVYNAFVVFDREGARVAHYRKRHPWYPEEWATAGRDPHPRFSIDGVAVTIAICFDVHFLENDAASELRASDVLLFPSAWVEDADTRATLLPHVARTFGTAVVNANWARGDVAAPGQGRSMIVDAQGHSLALAGTAESRIDAVLERGSALHPGAPGRV